MCSVIDNQKELRYSQGVVMTDEFAKKKVDQHVAYVLDIVKSKRDSKRKLELVKSCLGSLANFLAMVDSSHVSIYAAFAIVSMQIQIAMVVNKPIPKHDTGGVVHGMTNLGEMTDEIIIGKKKPKVPPAISFPQPMDLFKHFPKQL